MRYLIPVIAIIWTFLITNTAYAQNTYRADLVGESELPPLFSESNGTALVVGNDFKLVYQINVTSLDKVTGVYLYRGDSSENGQVVVALLNSTKPTGVIKGTLAEGIIDSSSLRGPLANKNLTSLIELINQNLTYINIHTSKYPDGELRGTLMKSTTGQQITFSNVQVENWIVKCKTIENFLVNTCNIYVNPEGSLTQEGIRAKDCIFGGALLSGAGVFVGRSPTEIISMLEPAATLTGCGGIVDFVKLKQATDPSSLLKALGIQ